MRRRVIIGVAASVGALLIALAIGLGWVPLGSSRPAPQDLDRPNVLLLSMDTTRRDHVSFYGHEHDTTPQLRRFVAERGIVFDGAVAAHTNTAPAHASMLTGLYPATHGVHRNGVKLSEDIPVLGELLEERGYETAGFVSGWTLTKGASRLDRGFDTYDDRMPGPGRRKGAKTLEAALPWVTERIEDGDPFFLFFHLFDPHFPYDPPQELADEYLPDDHGRWFTEINPKGLPGLKVPSGVGPAGAREYIARYDGEIRYADRQMGRLLELLERRGVLDNTLVIFLSDHGETLYERDWVFDHGGRAYDEQIRVPMAIRLPGGAHAGKRVEAQAHHVDVMPTVLDVVGADVPSDLHGRSLTSLIEDRPPGESPQPGFAHCRPEPARVPEIEAPLVRRGLVSVIRLPNVKLIEYPLRRGGWFKQLFDLADDPSERENIAADRPALVDRLHQELERWRAETGGEKRPAPPKLSPEAEEKLRALGYVQ